MTTKEILVKARATIEDPKHWTTGSMAKDVYGGPIGPDSVFAMRFCMIGAVHHCFTDGGEWRIGELLDERRKLPLRLLAATIRRKYRNRLTSEDYLATIAEFNDNIADHAAMLDVFDAAIADADPYWEG
jgi:hypothetical protein